MCKFPMSTTFPVLRLAMLPSYKGPAYEEEGINAMHLNFNRIFCNVEQNLQSGQLHQ